MLKCVCNYERVLAAQAVGQGQDELAREALMKRKALQSDAGKHCMCGVCVCACECV